MSKILLIDDKMDNLVTLSALLDNLMPGCAVITAQSGMEGIEKTRSELPDAILLDVKMPGMDGFETCRRLKSDESAKHIPVIMITAIKTDPQSRIKGLEIGADAFLAKPIDPYELVSQVNGALRIKKAEDALREERDSLERLVEKRTAALKDRLKEMALLQSISQIIEEEDGFEGICQKIACAMPNGFYYPEIACARIVCEGQSYQTENFSETEWCLSADLKVKDKSAGAVEVFYLEERPAKDEGPFINEERDLINLCAERLGRVTERKRAEEALREKTDFLHNIIDTTSDLVSVTDMEGNLKFIGPSHSILGYDPDSLVGRNVLEFVHPDDYQKIATSFANFRANREDGRMVGYRYRRADGDYLWLETVGKFILDDAGNPKEILFTSRDFTARKRAEGELKRIEWMLSTKPVSNVESQTENHDQGYGDLTELNRDGVILKSIGNERLKSFANDYLELLGTSSAIYEVNGDYAFGIFASGWCRMMDSASRKLCNTPDNVEALNSGRWLCHESCWTDCAKKAIAKRAEVDIECNGGIRMYAVPIYAGGNVIGVINFGYGDPPKDPEKLKMLADACHLTYDDLLREAAAYDSRPPYIIEMAKKRLNSTATLIGSMVETKQATEALRDSEEKHRRLFETMAQGVIYEEAGGVIVSANPAAEKILGLTFEQMQGKTSMDPRWKMIREDGSTVPGTEHPAMVALRTGRTIGPVIRGVFHPEKNATIWLNITAIPLFQPGETAPFQSYSTFEDISDRKQAEDDLSRANARLEALWNVLSLDGSDLQTVSNHVLESIVKMTQSPYGFYGFVNEEETGMTIHSWSGKAMENCSIKTKPSYFPICEAGVWGEAIRRREPFILNDYWAMHPAKKGLPQGHVQLTKLLVVPFILNNRITSVAAVANRTIDYNQDDITQITSFLYSIQAIVDSKQAEERLRESEALLYATAKIAKIGGWELDAQTLEVTWTAETYLIHDVPLDFKPSLQDAINFFHPEDRDKLTSAIQRSLENGEPYDLEIRFITAKGNHLWTRTICQPYIVNGEVITLKGIFQDISQRKRAEEEKEKLQAQLTQSQKLEAIGNLAGGIAHDFNNILSPIMLHSEMAMMDLPADSPVQQNLQQIYRSGERARDLVKQILTFARKGKEERIPIKASLIVKEAVKFLRSTIPTTIDIRYECRTGLDLVLADPTQLSQIVMNLCTNAAHAMEEKGGSIEVILENETLEPNANEQITIPEPGRYVKLTVNDIGHGIAPNLLDKIFEPYFTTKEVGKGTGLGLALVHGIVKSYGGEITVQSEVGTGTCFSVYLPLIEGAGDVAETTADAAQFPGGTERILFIDDEMSVVNVMKPILEKLGYEVTANTSSIEALELFREKPDGFDIVITDQTMPNMTGKALAGEIMSIRPNMPIILCTGFSEQIDESVAKEMGILGFVMKPLVMNEMANKIRQILDRK